ncbi:hypothetical protein J1N35_036285 [Gossypium stocksii]|uniref:Uncharacterized protein n=1 Tax=Gossypium stocksii TaxID=47602 RepID=A0A9D3UHU7_9ROSI|nr:hypothetical protein J1N35_036285 [Gossypium stocksii]
MARLARRGGRMGKVSSQRGRAKLQRRNAKNLSAVVFVEGMVSLASSPVCHELAEFLLLAPRHLVGSSWWLIIGFIIKCGGVRMKNSYESSVNIVVIISRILSTFLSLELVGLKSMLSLLNWVLKNPIEWKQLAFLMVLWNGALTSNFKLIRGVLQGFPLEGHFSTNDFVDYSELSHAIYFGSEGYL